VTAIDVAARLPRRRRKPRTWSHRVAIGSGIVIGLIIVAAVFAPLIAPDNPNAISLGSQFAPSSAAHLLGTDASGRDILSRLLYGARPALIGPTVAVLVAAMLATLLAVLCAWLGGWFDRIISRAIDILFAFPGVLLALLAAAVFGAGFVASILAVGIAEVPYIARVIRTEAMRQRSRPYIEGALVQGFASPAVIVRHLIPNLMPTVITQIALSFGYVIMNLAAISYLGLGIQPPNADWGSMVSDGQSSIIQGYPEEALYAAACIVVLVVAFTLLGDHVARRLESRR